MLGVCADVRTTCQIDMKDKYKNFTKGCVALRDIKASREMLDNIRTLRRNFEPVVMARRDAEKAQRAKAYDDFVECKGRS